MHFWASKLKKKIIKRISRTSKIHHWRIPVFGLCVFPRHFTSVMRPLIYSVRLQGVKCSLSSQINWFMKSEELLRVWISELPHLLRALAFSLKKNPTTCLKSYGYLMYREIYCRCSLFSKNNVYQKHPSSPFQPSVCSLPPAVALVVAMQPGMGRAGVPQGAGVALLVGVGWSRFAGILGRNLLPSPAETPEDSW